MCPNAEFFTAVTLERNEKESKTPILDSAWENFCLVEQFFGRCNASTRMERKLKNGQRRAKTIFRSCVEN